MIETTIARRYAKALLEVAAGEQRVRETQGELSALAGLYRSAAEFRTILVSPVIPRRRRREETGKALAGRVGPSVVSFLQTLVDGDRAGLLPEISDVFDDLADDQESLVRVVIRSARPLEASQVGRLRTAIERFSRGRRVEIEAEVDPALIGGLTIRARDTVVDGSVLGWMKRTRDRLVRQSE
jgi:F-type H+-transporting ATPase subunit delta